MEKKIWVVEKTTGEYEDRFTEILIAKTTRESAEAFMNDQIKKYEGIHQISEFWDSWEEYVWNLIPDCDKSVDEKGESYVEGDVLEEAKEKYLGDSESFISYIKKYFPNDFERFGEERLKFAFDLEERGLLDENTWYNITEVILED